MGEQAHESFALLFEFFALADITGNGRCPDNGTAAILDGGNGDRNAQQAPVLAHARRLVVIYTLSMANTLHDLPKLIGTIRWEEEGDRLTHDFLGAIAVHAFCCGIPTDDYAIQIFTQNGILGRGNNRGQVLTRLLCPPAVGDVAYVALKHFTDRRWAEEAGQHL